MLDNLKKALAAGDFDQFFLLFSQTDRQYCYELAELAKEAVNVAELKKDIAALKRIAKLNLDRWRNKEVFSNAIKSLITLGKLDAALSLVTFNDHVDHEEAWQMFIELLIECGEFPKARKVLINITNAYNRNSIISKCLNIINPEQIFEWLSWFEIYSTETYNDYHSSDYINKAVLIIKQYEPLNEISQEIRKWTDTDRKFKLLINLHVHFLLEENIESCQQIELIVPKNLLWLLTMRRAVDDEQYFEVFKEHGEYECREIVRLSLSRFIARNHKESDPDLLKKIDALISVREYSDDIDSIISILIYKQRIDLVLELILRKTSYRSGQYLAKIAENKLTISQVDKLIEMIESLTKKRDTIYYHLDEVRLKLLENNKLTHSQYPRIIKSIKQIEIKPNFSYRGTEEKILDLIPSDIINAERKERAAQQERARQERARSIVSEAKTNFTELSNVNKKHEKYNRLRSSIAELLKVEEFELAILLLEKIVPSVYRNDIAYNIIQQTLMLEQYHYAKTAASMLLNSEKSKKSLLKGINQCIANKYKTAFIALLSLDNLCHYGQPLLGFAIKILNDPGDQNCTEFFINSGIFNLELHTSASTNESVLRIRQLIAKRIYDQAKDLNALQKKMKRLKERGIKGLEEYLLVELLSEGRLEAGILLVNMFVQIETYDGRKVFPTHLRKILENHLEKLLPTAELMQSLSLLETEQCIMAVALLGKEKLLMTRASVAVLSEIPDQKLRDDTLIEFMLDDMMSENSSAKYYLATLCAELLSEKLAIIFKKIVEYTLNQQFDDVIRELVDNADNNSKFLYWILKQWVNAKSVSELLQIVHAFTKEKADVDTEQSQVFDHITHQDTKKDGESEKYYKFWDHYEILKNIDQILYRIINTAYRLWFNTLKKHQNYDSIILGITQLFKQHYPFINKFIDFLCDLHQLAKLLLDPKNHSLLLAVIQLIEKCEAEINDDSDYHPKLRILMPDLCHVLLEDNQLSMVETLLGFIDTQDYQSDSIIIGLVEKYLHAGNIQAVIELLGRPGNKTFLISGVVVKWIKKLIDRDKLSQAQLLIDTCCQNGSESDYIQIVESLLTKGYIDLPRCYIKQKIKLPGTVIRLRQQLQANYLSYIRTVIGQESFELLIAIHIKVSTLLRYLDKPNKYSEARRVQNEIVVEARSLLDKSFRTFYAQYYEANRLSFPIILNLNEDTVLDRLTHYFAKEIKNSDFILDHPKVFTLLQEIQGAVNPDFNWLYQLALMANMQKHEATLELNPTIDDTIVDMTSFLSVMLNGLTESMLRMFKPLLTSEQLGKLKFTSYIEINMTKQSASNLFMFSSSNSLPTEDGVHIASETLIPI